ncbi:MAG TPA: DUF6065 family protein [Caulobacterales bacterium]|nr:DUF6065 family protein [Caulobacterales bacterium]
MKIMCYPVTASTPPIEPGAAERDWMDAFMSKHPYRCLPLVIANTSGWQLILPISFRATWNGGPAQHDIVFEPPFGKSVRMLEQFVSSHFGGGVLTFHTHYLFRTPKDWDLWVGGPPNSVKHGIQALTGIIETSWLPMTFTMNWRFTAPGSVAFNAGEPFCFMMPTPHRAIDDFEMVIGDLAANPELKADTEAWQESRRVFIAEGHASGASGEGPGWQRHYFQGLNIDGSKGPSDHIHKRRLKAPRTAGEGEDA